uniref:Uncharacterized protein LOC100181739 n=1 Tax=Phallusia mammillata TaxID=59560 RepID=A0A6F9DGU1_9ASCI|nr:uncharacterized protein LOC100181739 [Phallusia mammillata]
MRVVVAGLYKTGTKTLKQALETLGYNVWDVSEQLNAVCGGPMAWEDLLQTNADPIVQLQKMLQYCDAVTDGPSAVLAPEVAQAFPESKVVLCVRDNEHVWYKSYEKSRDTLNWNFFVQFFRLLSHTARRRYEIMRLVNDSLSSGRFSTGVYSLSFGLSPVLCKHAYLAHNALVEEQVPENRLLKFNVKEGWKPLCDFLGHEVPSVPFPHANRGAFNASLPGFLDYMRYNSAKDTRNKVFMETAFALMAIATTFLALYIAFHLN